MGSNGDQTENIAVSRCRRFRFTEPRLTPKSTALSFRSARRWQHSCASRARRPGSPGTKARSISEFRLASKPRRTSTSAERETYTELLVGLARSPSHTSVRSLKTSSRHDKTSGLNE